MKKEIISEEKTGKKLDITIPIDIEKMFRKALAYKSCKDACISRALVWRRAAYFERKYDEASVKAWGALYQVFPELKGSELTYNTETGIHAGRLEE